LIRELNRIVIKNSNYEKFITVFLARYNFVTRELKYVNAGHNPPVMYNFETGEKTFLSIGGQGVGMIDDPDLKEGFLVLTSDTRILCYTDGVCEIEKDGEEYYGQQVIENRTVSAKTVSDVVSEIISDLNINRDNDSLADDATLLGIDLYVR
jgi:sigma-B regulation protein RsbU (phosphoserine phosphatase)